MAILLCMIDRHGVRSPALGWSVTEAARTQRLVPATGRMTVGIMRPLDTRDLTHDPEGRQRCQPSGEV